MEQEVSLGVAGGEPCHFFQIQPSPEGFRIWRRWRGPNGSPAFWPGTSARLRARGQPFPPGVGWQLRGRRQEEVFPRTPSGRVWELGDLESPSAWYAWLVVGTGWGPQERWPPGTSTEGVGLLQTSPTHYQTAWCGNYYQAPPSLWCNCRKSFLPQPSPKFACWDIRESQLEKMVAYGQALQFGWRKPIHLPRANHAFWQGVYWSWGRRWNIMSPSLMKPSSVVWPSQRNPWPCSQRKPHSRMPSHHMLTPLLKRPLWRLL